MSTFNGIGIKLIKFPKVNLIKGYIATEWFVICWLPIIPITSYIVWKEETKNNSYIIVFSRQTNYSLSAVRLYWYQILTIYYIYSTIIFLIVLVNSNWVVATLLFLLSLTLFFLFKKFEKLNEIFINKFNAENS